MGNNHPLVAKAVYGKGTNKDPRVSVQMPEAFFYEIRDNRRDGCIRQAWAAAMALEWPHVVIRTWNHNTQFVYDRYGNRLYFFDQEGNRRPRIIPADSHLTVLFKDPRMGRFCYGHIYTVDDQNGVPQRLMLIGERKHTRDHDHQSPQLWWSDTKQLEKQLLTEKDDVLMFIQKQWVHEAILFDIERQIDLTAATDAYMKEFEDMSDEELFQWYVPEVLRRYEAALGKPQSVG
jgi:hypothetical protein